MSTIKSLFFRNKTPLSLGDSMTFDEIYRVYFAVLCYFAGKFVEKETAEDVVNTLFLKLWDCRKEFESVQHLQSFLYLSIKNACLDHLKMTTRAKDREGKHCLSIEYIEENYEQEMIRAEYWGEIYRAIQKLPSQCSKVIHLSFVEGFTNEEISKQLKLSPQTVRNQKSKGIKALRKSLSPDMAILVLLASILQS